MGCKFRKAENNAICGAALSRGDGKKIGKSYSPESERCGATLHSIKNTLKPLKQFMFRRKSTDVVTVL